MIYAVEAFGSGCIKFGIAKLVGHRIKNLQVGCPYELAVRAVADWPDSAEMRIHSYLITEHVRGEWFKDGDKASSVIALMNTGSYIDLDNMIVASMPRRLRHHLAIIK